MRFRNVLVLAAILASCATAPSIPKNRYGLEVVPDVETYRRMAKADSRMAMVELPAAIPGLRVDVRYATADNFMKKPLYPVAKVMLRAPAARALSEVQRELAAKGLGLKVFDGYRPYRVTEAMWEPIKNPDYVADPSKGSRHNRGAAVDLTIVDLATGEELAMPTPYDDFTPRARQDFMDLPENLKVNRELLREVMVRHGFEALPSEWWHFDFAGWRSFPLMDIPLDADLSEL
jgi:D-alanyl-D-alanine dipeptidase